MTRYINMSPRSGSSDIFLGFLLSHQGSIPGEGWGLWGGGRQKFKKQKKKMTRSFNIQKEITNSHLYEEGTYLKDCPNDRLRFCPQQRHSR